MNKQYAYNYNPSIDTLRFISIVFVIVSHWGPTHFVHGYRNVILTVFRNGLFGVDIFFVISGFLITFGILGQQDKENFRFGRELYNFYIKRIFRIFPIYYLFLFISYIVNYDGFRSYSSFYLCFSANWYFFKIGYWNSFGHLWSLSVEEQFYLIWPVIIFSLKRKYLVTFLVLTIFSSICFDIFSAISWGDQAHLLTPNCLMALCSGFLLAYLIKSKNEMLSYYRNYINVLGILFTVVFVIIQIEHLKFIAPRIINSVMGFAILNYLNNNPLILSYKVFVHVGKISYGIYLYHMLIGEININHFFFISNNYYVIYAIRIILLLIVAHMSYYLLEIRLILLAKNKLQRK